MVRASTIPANDIPELPISSHIHGVVVHARGAVVTRTLSLPKVMPRGPADLVVPGITPLAIPASFRAEVDGGRPVLGVVTRLDIPEEAKPEGDLERALKGLRQKIEALEQERQTWLRKRQLLGEATLSPRLSKKRYQEDPAGRIQHTLAAQTLLQRLEEQADQKLIKLDRQIATEHKAMDALATEAAQSPDDALKGRHHPTIRAFLRLASSDQPLEGIRLSYAIREARWWPTYAVHLTDSTRRAELTVDALVAQASFEDWDDVTLELSTADLIHDVRLPELTSLRLSRAQPKLRRGFRPPPEGLETMFAGFDEALGQARPNIGPLPPDLERLQNELGFKETVKARALSSTSGALTELPAGELTDDDEFLEVAAPPEPQPMTAALEISSMDAIQAAPMAMPAAPPISRRARRMISPQDGAELKKMAFGQAVPHQIEPEDGWLNFDALTLGGLDQPQERGQLLRREHSHPSVEALRSQVPLAHAPSGALQDPMISRGLFDHRYSAEGPAQVPSNGRTHRVSMTRHPLETRGRLVTVPRAVDGVYREVELVNPLDAPLLAGPVDVTMDGALLTTTHLDHPVDRGGGFTVGLGLEERVRVARNARTTEGTVGMLSSTTAIDHEITIDLVSALGHPISVEVLERIPVTDDKEIEIEVIEASPKPTPYHQKERGQPIDGGLAWRISIEPGGKRTIRLHYRIELPSKSEIAGGNRRE